MKMHLPTEDVQRLEDQIGQLIRIVANLNERLHAVESASAEALQKTAGTASAGSAACTIVSN